MPPQVEQFVHGRLFASFLTAVLVWLAALVYFSSKDEKYILERYRTQNETFGLVQELLTQVAELKDLKIVSNEQTQTNTERSITNRKLLNGVLEDFESMDTKLGKMQGVLERFEEDMLMLLEDSRED